MDMYWWTLQITKPVLAVIAAIGFSKFLLPLKQGWREENQKLISKGVAFLILGVGGLAILISIINKG